MFVTTEKPQLSQISITNEEGREVSFWVSGTFEIEALKNWLNTNASTGTTTKTMVHQKRRYTRRHQPQTDLAAA